ncbi:glycosyltransferase [Rothia sp. LK2588]|uniref:glycosyltransferase family 2 protein n=1 Tax=Rothia sp. LK2588 TaxID=3114369 RepID=UPI0034CD6AE7
MSTQKGPAAVPGASGVVGHSEQGWPIVSVVVPYFENPQGLTRIVEALAAQTYPGEIELVVADDGSSPELAPRLPEDPGFPVRVVAQEDRGFRAAAARNLGAKHATGQVLAFLDGDTVPRPDYLREAVTAMAGELRALVVGTRLHADGREPDWLVDAWKQTDHLAAADDASWRFVISAVLTCSRSFFELVGGFDETLVGYGGEDWEFAWRAWNAGARFAHAPAAIADHPENDWGNRHDDPARAAAEKNVESIALARRISHPMARPASVHFNTPDVAVCVPTGFTLDVGQGARGWAPGAVIAVIADWLTHPGVHVVVDAELDRAGVAGTQHLELFADDPRVHVNPAGPDWQEYSAQGSEQTGLLSDVEPDLTAGPLGARVWVRLLAPAAPTDLEDIYRVARIGGNALITDRSGTHLARVETRRWHAIHDDEATVGTQSTASERLTVLHPWTLRDEPTRLEGVFAGW